MKLTDKQKGYLFLFGPVVAVYLLLLYFATTFTLVITAGMAFLLAIAAAGLSVLRLMFKGADMLMATDTRVGRWLKRHLK